MGKRFSMGVLLCALLLFMGISGFAQESTVKGNLSGVVLDATGAVVQGATVPGLRLVANLGLVLCAASACFALAAAFLRFAGRHRPVFESLADNAYGIYLVHYVFVIWLQYMLLHAPLFAVAKAAIVFTGTLTLSWAITAAICRIPIGARLMGRNRREWARAR